MSRVLNDVCCFLKHSFNIQLLYKNCLIVESGSRYLLAREKKLIVITGKLIFLCAPHKLSCYNDLALVLLHDLTCTDYVTSKCKSFWGKNFFLYI